MKSMPFGSVWDEFCLRMGVPAESDIISEVLSYEEAVLKERA
jgi:L-rhamnose isomerase